MGPVLAIAWATWRRHCRGIRIAAGALAAMALLYPVLFSFVRVPAVLAVSLLPPVFVVAFFMNMLLFTNNVGDLASGYQRRLYDLPVRTVTLVTWPMFFGAASVALLWIVFRLIFQRSGLRPPMLVPAISLAALMGWLQALAWSPFAHRWVRVVLAGVLLPGLAAPVVWLWLTHHASSGQITLLLVAYCGAAYAVALAGVRRDRCGELSLVGPAPFRFMNLRAAGQRTRPYRSAARAQTAYEWRSHGLMLPAFTGGLVAVSLVAMTILARPAKPGSVMLVLVLCLLMPVLLAGSFGANIVRKTSGSRRGSTFLMTRPMTSTDLALAKFRMAFRSVLLTWAIVGGLAVLFVGATGLTGDVLESRRLWLEPLPAWKAAGAVVLAVIALPLATWKQFTNTLILRLTGREWLMIIAEFAKGTVLMLAISVGLWFSANPAAFARFQSALPVALPWLLGGVLAIKGGVAIGACRALLSRGLAGTRTVTALVGGWFVASTCLAGLIALVLPLGRSSKSGPGCCRECWRGCR